MKKIKLSIITLIGCILLMQTSCKKSDFTDANNNPNAPKTVFLSMLLNSAIPSLAYAQGGDMSRFVSMFMQQTYGAYRQSAAYYSYILTAQDVDGLWGNLYTAAMQNTDSLIVQADRAGANRYSGCGRILMAYSLQITVDCWGKIPYSTAFMGRLNLKPTYDDDKGLYDVIAKLCDDGITKLNMPYPGKDSILTDVLYGGDVTKWIKFAHAIKARLYMHQSKNNTQMATSALAEIAQSFADNTDNATYNFGTTEPTSNPWYQFYENRGDISYLSGTMIQNMWANGDPRLTILVDTINDNLLFYGNQNSPVEFITYDELQFMTAEATLTTGGSVSSAKTAYINGITANMTKLGVTTAQIDTYIVHNGAFTSANALSMIANEEYMALYLNPEVWSLWRRTGLPVLTPAVSGHSIPRRLLYPQTELSYNSANTPQSSLYTPQIFWDK